MIFGQMLIGQLMLIYRAIVSDLLDRLQLLVQQMFDNFQSFSGIESVGAGELDISMVNHNDSTPKNEYTIKINAPEGHLNSFPIPEKLHDMENKKIATRNSYNTDTTGYDINRELFSEDDLHEAFNVIDINNDGCLTAEELSFFLKCVDQPHTSEEVEEMIRMVSSDGKKVMMEDFKKIGRGKLPPFAAIKHSQHDEAVKQQVLENVRQSLLTSIDPDEFFEAKEELQLSRERYQEQKASHEDCHEAVLEPVVEENGGMKLRTIEQLKHKKSQYAQVMMLNVERAIEAVRYMKTDVVELVQLAQRLSIAEAEARMLFERSRLSAREVIFDLILFSPSNNLRKLQLILNNRGRQEALSLQDWVGVLCFMMGLDQKQFIRRRLQNVLRHRKIQMEGRFDKYFVLQVMTQEYALFLW